MDTSTSIHLFFRDELESALRQRGFESGTLTEHYLVQLLAAYVAQPLDEQPLALKLLSAMASGPRERRTQLRQVGDTSLFVSGFWSDSFAGRLVDVDYYIGLGGSAYGELARAGSPTEDAYGQVFGELAAHFARFVEVLALVSRRTTSLGTNQDILRLYERWRRGGSRWAARRLAALGVVTPKNGGRLQ